MPKTIKVKVLPKSSRCSVEHCGDIYRVKVTAAPDKGKANKAVIELISDFLSVSKSKIKIVKGLTGREKVLLIED